MNTEQEMKAYLDGWFFSIDFEKGRTISTDVPVDYIPSHKPKYFAEDEDAPENKNAHRWTEHEDKTLISLRNQGKTFKEIGEAINLSTSSAQNRYEVLRARYGFKRAFIRHSKFPAETVAKIVELRDMGMGFHEISPIVGIARTTANDIYRRYKKGGSGVEDAA